MLDEVTTVGLFLTLVGLLAGFYWFNLAGWVSGLIELKSEAAYYKGSDGKEDERAMISAKVQGRGSWSNIVTAVAVSIFTVVLVLSALDLASDVEGNLGNRLVMALWVFLGLYIGLTLFLLVHGYLLVGQIKKLVN